MPDLTPLPPLGEAPRFAPSDERFALAARAARRRRAVRTSIPAGAAAAAVLAAVVTTGASSSTGLRPTAPLSGSPSPAATASAAPSESPTPSPAPGNAPATGPVPSPASGSPTASQPPAPPSARPDPSGSPRPSATRPPVYVVSPQPIHPEEGPNRRAGFGYFPLGDAASCGGTWGAPGNPWCARYSGPRTVRAGETATFVFDLCRTTEDGHLVFDTERELAFALGDADAGGWTSRPGGGLRRVPVAAGQCARWLADWTVPAGIAEGAHDLRWSVAGDEAAIVTPAQRTVVVQGP